MPDQSRPWSTTRASHSDAADPSSGDSPSRAEHPPPTGRAKSNRSSRRTMETVLLASTACLLAATGWQVLERDWDHTSNSTAAILPGGDTPTTDKSGSAVVAPASQPTIQVALILDTSSSMDGLIDQARRQLWSVINALDSATYQGGRPQLEIAIYEYGNDALDAEDGYIRRVSGFSAELDIASESLFELTTSGGEEYAGQAIARSVDELEWRTGDNVLRVVYIAGNESFAQGPYAFREAIAKAKRHGVVVNTINCVGVGDLDEGWAEAARLAGGKSLRIDHDKVIEYEATPLDDDIADLGLQLNDTYVAYGADGTRGLDNLVAQDHNSANVGGSSVVDRSLSKSSGYYRNPDWDLVDAIDGGLLSLRDISGSDLPDVLEGLDEQQATDFLAGKSKERGKLKSKLRKLQKKRAAFLSEKRGVGDALHLETAIVGSITEQAVAAGFTLDVS